MEYRPKYSDYQYIENVAERKRVFSRDYRRYLRAITRLDKRKLGHLNSRYKGPVQSMPKISDCTNRAEYDRLRKRYKYWLSKTPLESKPVNWWLLFNITEFDLRDRVFSDLHSLQEQLQAKRAIGPRTQVTNYELMRMTPEKIETMVHNYPIVRDDRVFDIHRIYWYS